MDRISHIFRSFYAIRNLSNKEGLPTNAVFGFASMLRKLIRQYQPDYIAVIFDGSEPTFRHETFQDYKANRTEMPDDLAVQLPYIRKLCEALNLPILEMERYEADDIIGTFAKKADQEGLQTVIVSNDKDMFQLVTERIKVLHQSKEDILFDSAKVKDFFGVLPSQVVDVLGLTGDTVDNIPGAPGIGEKGARDLISRFGSLDNLLANCEQVERKTYRESLQKHREQILQSKELVTIDTRVPLQINWSELQARAADISRLRDLFTGLGFQSMLKEYESEGPKVESPPSFQTITTRGQVEQLIKELSKQDMVFCYLELDHEEPMLARPLSLALAGQQTGWIARSNDSSLTLTDFRSFWEDPKIPKVLHNSKAVHVLLAREGIPLRGVEWDTMLMSYLIQPNRSNHNFEEITFARLEKTPTAAPDQRCVLTRDLFATLLPGLKELKLEKVYREIELPLAEVLATMEWNGIRVDPAVLVQMSAEFEKQIQVLT
ncbi:MAG: hypothetical protein DMG06_30865, partial [Acidobacteria bacterium]